jgi:hypothetical protein
MPTWSKHLECVILVGVLCMALLTSCSEQPASMPQVSVTDTTGVSSTGAILLNGHVVVIPPPALVSHLIVADEIPFDPSAAIDAAHPEQWTGEVKKALNLGVLGADLSYLINHKRNTEIPTYLASIRRLTDDLGISHEVDTELLNQLEAGLDRPEQMLGLQSIFFQNLQKYLAKNNRIDINTCILLGGWTESMYQLSSPADSVAGHPLDRVLAEQTYTAEGVRALAASIQNEAFAEIQQSIFNLCDALSELETSYEFREPIHDHRQGVTYLRSSSPVNCSDAELVNIHELIRETRERITAP